MLLIPLALFGLMLIILVVVLAILVGIVLVCELGALVFSKARFLSKMIFGWISFWITTFIFLLRGVFRALRVTVRGIAFVIEQFISVVREPILVRERDHQASSLRDIRRTRFSTVRPITWSWFAPTCVLGVFLAFSGSLNGNLSQLFTAKAATSIRSDFTSSDNDRESLTENRPQTAEHGQREKKPNWIAEGDTTSGDIRRIVLSSQLWSTVEEAKTELLSNATAIIQKDFEQRHHGILDPKQCRLPSGQRLEQIAVKERHVEQYDMDFGIMNRVYWLVEVSPIVRTELYSYWKAAKNQNRTIALGIVLSLLTMVANAGVLCATLKRGPQFSARGAMTSAISCITAWSLISFSLAIQLML